MPRTTTIEQDTRPLLDQARSAVAGYDDAKAAEQAVKDRRAALVGDQPTDSPANVVDTIVGAALNGDDLAALEVGTRAMDADRAFRAQRAEQEALGKAADALVQHRQTRLADGITDALAVIRAELDDVITEAREVSAALDGIADADAAIDAGVTSEWKRYGELATRYAEVRTAQVVVMSAAARAGDVNATEDGTDRDTRALLDLYGWLENPAAVAEINDYHRAGRTRGPVVNNGVTVSAPLPWLDQVPGVALAVALVDDARPWVADPDQIEAARLADITGEPLADNLDPEAEERRVKARAARTQKVRQRHGMTAGDRTHLDYDRH